MWKSGFVLILLIAIGFAGCAKKQIVRSDAAAESAAVQPVKPVETAKSPEKPVGTPVAEETINPKSAVNAPNKPAEGAGVLVTEEIKSPYADIHFDFDKAFIHDGDKPVLRKIAAYLKQHPNVRLRIEGNCDERGTAEYNMALGERRADGARKYLVDLGVPAKKISTISFGKEKPLDSGHSEEAWAKNRRDHFDTM
ncbi:MAG: peptidoglycan-associated lipoprotein Pal [bacterium]|nr:peptidoglycan-associated lipoprotein Pal [bacterium]